MMNEPDAWVAVTYEPTERSTHQTAAAARKAANERTGRWPGSFWERYEADTAPARWEKGEGRELTALVFRRQDEAAIATAFGNDGLGGDQDDY